jgi:hypothetical protein
MSMRTFGLVVALVVALSLTIPVAAQVTTADLFGRVVDPKELAIVGAKVTATNPETGFSRETTTGASGDYALLLLPVGTYKITVEAQGFATVVFPKVNLAVAQKQTLDARMKLGTARETVVVTEEPPLVETTRSDLGGTVSPAEVKNLPNLDRNFADLMQLIPGVRPAQSFDPTKTRSGNVSVNGGDGRGIDYNVDGGDNKDNVIGGIVQNFTMEGIQEFQVATDRYTAESGRAATAIVNVISKSGTNQIHGSLFGLFQVSTLNKNDFLLEKAGSPKPVFHKYQFGGSIGAPIIKDKLFIFGAYENKRQPGGIAASPPDFAQLQLFTPLASPVSTLPAAYIDHLLTVKLDWAISNKQHFFARYGRERWVNPNDQLGAPGSFFATDASGGNSTINQFHSLVLSHNYVFSPTKTNTFAVQFQDFVNAILAAPGSTFTLPVFGGTTVTNPEICFGAALGCGSGPGEPEIGQNVNVPQQTLIRKYQFRDDFTWVHGKHNLKFGGNEIYLAKLGGFFFFGANGYQVTFWDDINCILNRPGAPASCAGQYPMGFATPGAVRELSFNGGSGNTTQPPAHELAFYVQDDYRITPNLTLNLGLRWDANPNFLPQQLGSSATTTNRTISILQQVAAVASPPANAVDGVNRARSIVGNTGDLTKRTADFKEFQPRVGFAWDPIGTGKWVIRGGYGIARDQVFQNLTLFSLQQSQPTIYQTIIDLVAAGRPGACSTPGGTPQTNLCLFHFPFPGAAIMDPLPAPAPGITSLAVGAFGRINDPRITDPWSQQASIGTTWQFSPDFAFSADYYHVLGTHESRVQNINPVLASLCQALLSPPAPPNTPAYPGGNPLDPRCIPARGGSTRFFDAAFVAAGLQLPADTTGRLEQINMIGTTNRSLYDGINLQLRKRMSHHFMFQVSDVISWSRSWGGRAVASYSGNGQAVTPDNEFLPSEFGPTDFDERNRFVASGIFDLPWGFQISPVFQASSALPYRFRAAADIDGDGRTSIDRVCVGSSPATPSAASNFTLGCTQVKPNSLRGDALAQLNLRIAKNFKFTERMQLTVLWEFFNLFNRNNFCNNVQTNAQASNFGQPLGYCGGQSGFGEATAGPLHSQFGFRFEF